MFQQGIRPPVPPQRPAFSFTGATAAPAPQPTPSQASQTPAQTFTTQQNLGGAAMSSVPQPSVGQVYQVRRWRHLLRLHIFLQTPGQPFTQQNQGGTSFNHSIQQAPLYNQQQSGPGQMSVNQPVAVQQNGGGQTSAGQPVMQYFTVENGPGPTSVPVSYPASSLGLIRGSPAPGQSCIRPPGPGQLQYGPIPAEVRTPHGTSHSTMVLRTRTVNTLIPQAWSRALS